MHHGRPNIDAVPTVITEQVWVALALIAASLPILLRIATKFTTSGLVLGGLSRSSEPRLLSLKMRDTSGGSSGSRVEKRIRIDEIEHRAVEDEVGHCWKHSQSPGDESASVGSRADSQKGILQQVGPRASLQDRLT